MPVFDTASKLWANQPIAAYYRDITIHHRQQVGGSCVSTCLSLLSGQEPTEVRSHVNTQDPVSWSHYLQGYGMKLAYCPSDLRRLQHYLPDLLAIDDLFTISTYSPPDSSSIGAEPNEDGWICGSHIVLLHRSTVYDTRYAAPIALNTYADKQRYVKRLFRVVPVDHARGL
ncbi:MAG: hypothetical protein K9K38_05645 [Rhodoferax sp.]|nr:hypothetical protein [Rhodoferax sp.]